MQVSTITSRGPLTPSTRSAQVAPPPDGRDTRTTTDAFVEQLKSLRQQAKAQGAVPFTTPFKVQLEVKAQAHKTQRLLNGTLGTRWTVSAVNGNNHNSGGDCSHSKDGGGAAFVRVQSPFMTVEDGAFQQMAEVVERLAESGAQTGSTGALRYSVNTLPEAAMRKLVATHLRYEDILFRLVRGDAAGRSLSHKKTYAVPLSRLGIMPDTSVDKLKRVLNRRHASVNTYTQGQVEFRYFDSTLKPQVLQANAALVLGMVSEASEGVHTRGSKHPVGLFNLFVAANRWENFIRETVGEGPIAKQLEQQFRSAGGRLW